MITGVRLSELAVGEPILSTSWEYKNLTGKDAAIKRLEDQFYHASYLGFTYIVDTIRPNITANGKLTVENNGINGDIWSFDERTNKYHELAQSTDMALMFEIEFTVQVTENNVDEYIRFILSNLVARYPWVTRWAIGVNPDRQYADGSYNCSPELYVYMINELYRQIKLFDHNILVGGPGIFESIDTFLNRREGWLAESTGEFYSKSSDYLNIGPHGFLTSIDFFTFQGRQDTSHYRYDNYSSIISNLRTLIYEHIGDNIVTLFSTTQGHQADYLNNTALMNQAYYDMREILQSIKCGVVPVKNELVDAYPDSLAWQGHFDSSRQNYGIMRWFMTSKVAYSTYKFIFDATKDYHTLHHVNDVFEDNDQLESITFKKVDEGLIYHLTIIWCKSNIASTVSLLSANFKREYQLENGTKTMISDNIDINLIPGHFLIVYDTVEELEINKDDIQLNIERRLRYQREINDQMLAELPSSYNKEVTDTNVYKILRSVAVELADASMILTMMKEDLYLDTVREDAIYENFGTLVKLNKRSDWTYEKYKKLVRGVMASLLKGPTVQSVIDALSLFTNFKVSIAECYKESTKIKYSDVMSGINPMFSFIIELEKPLEDQSMTQDELMEDTAYVLKLVKPAHTLGILVIILTGSERWDTYYNQRYGINWYEADETDLTTEFGASFNEGTYGWRHFNYAGNFHVSNSVVTNSHLLNNSALIGPRYILADHSIMEASSDNKELYDLSLELQEYIYTFLENASIDQYQTPSEYYSNIIENREAKFGHHYHKYLTLAGGKSTTTLNNYLLSTKSSLRDDLLIKSHTFFDDRYMFSNLLKVIRFSNNYGISAQFANNVDVLTHWQEYLNEHSFKEKIISLTDGTTISTERLNDITIDIEWYNSTFQEFNDIENIKEKYSQSTILYEDAHIPDDPLTSFRLNYPKDVNKGLNNHKLGPNRREKYNLTTFFNTLYDKANDYLAVAFGFELVEQYTREIKDNGIEFTFNPTYLEKYEIYKEPIRLNAIPEDLLTHRGLVQANDFSDEFSEFLGDPQIQDILKQVFENDYSKPYNQSNYNDSYNTSNLIVKLNLLREHPLLVDKQPQLDKWIRSIHGTLYTPTEGNKPFLRRTFIRKNVEKYTIGCGVKEEYFFKDDTNNNLINSYNNDLYDFPILEDEEHNNVALYEHVPFLDYPNLGLNFNNIPLTSSMFSISKTVLTELAVDKFFETYKPNNDDKVHYDFKNSPKDIYQFDINEQEEHNDVFTSEQVQVLDYFGIPPVQFNSSFNHFSFSHEKTKVIEWRPYYTTIYEKPIEQYLRLIYNYQDDNYNFPITEWEDHFDNFFTENASILDYANAPLRFNDFTNNDNRFGHAQFKNERATLYNRHYYYTEQKFKDVYAELLAKYSTKWNDIVTKQWIAEDLPFQTDLFEEYIIDRGHPHNRLVFNQSRFNHRQFAKTYQELATFYTNYSEEWINTPIDVYYPTNISFDYYTHPISADYKFFNFFKDRYQIYDEEQLAIQLNKSLGTFIGRRNNIITPYTYWNDNYLFTINDQLNIVNSTYLIDNYHPIEEQITAINNWHNDYFQIYDDENNIIRLNNSTGKFIKYRTAVHSFYTYYNDLYNKQIFDKFSFSTNSINNDIFAKPTITVANKTYASDIFKIYDNENETIKLNNSTGKFIKYRTAIHSFYTYYNDLYNKQIFESINFEDSSKETDVYEKPEEALLNYLYASEIFKIYDNENETIRLNNSTGKFIKYRTAVYSLNPFIEDVYTLPIYDKIYISTDYCEQETYIKPTETLLNHSYASDEFKIYDDENKTIRLNNSTGKFIKYKTAIHAFNSWQKDAYDRPIYESTSFEDSSKDIDKYEKPTELLLLNQTYATDEFKIYDDENKTIRLNNSTGKFVKYKTAIYALNPFVTDKYNITIYESTKINTDSYNNDQFKDIKESNIIPESSLEEAFILYDEETEFLRLSKGLSRYTSADKFQVHSSAFKYLPILGKFIGKRASISLPILDIKDKYHLFIYESSSFVLDNYWNDSYDHSNIIDNFNITNNIFNDTFQIYDDENEAIKLNNSTGKFIKYRAAVHSFKTYYNDIYSSPIFENFHYYYSTKYNDTFNTVHDSFKITNNLLVDNFVLYDDEKESLQLNHHNGKFIKYRTAIYSTQSTYETKYERPIFEETTFSNDSTNDERFPNIQILGHIVPCYEFAEHYIPYDECKALRLNSKRLNQSYLLGKYGSAIAYYTDYFEKWLVPTDQSSSFYSIPFNDIYSFNLSDNYNNTLHLNEHYIPYDEDKALRLNKRQLNRHFLLNRLSSNISFYTDYTEQYFAKADNYYFSINNPFYDKYQFITQDDNVQLQNDFIEQVNLQHISLRTNKTVLNKSILSGYDWDKLHPFIFYNDIYSNVITDKLINDIYLQYPELFPTPVTTNERYYVDKNTDKFNFKYLQKALNNSDIERDYNHFAYYDFCNDHIRTIYERILNLINWFNEDIIDVVNKVHEQHLIHYQSFNDDAANFKANNKKFTFTSETFNTALSNNADLSIIDIDLNQCKDKFIPKDDTPNYNLFDNNEDIREKEIIDNHESKFTSQDKYHNLNSLKPNLQLNLIPLGQGTLMTNNEQTKLKVTIKDKYHPTPIEIEGQRIIELIEKINKPKVITIIEMGVHSEKCRLQPSMNPFKFTTSQFSIKQFPKGGIIDIHAIGESCKERVRKPIEGVIHLHLNQCKFHDKVSRIKDESLTTTTYVNIDKYIFKMKEHCYLDTDVRVTDRYQPQSAVAYFKLEKVLRDKILTIRRGTYV